MAAAKILGHSNVKMTDGYVEIAKEHIAKTGDTAGRMWRLLEGDAGNEIQTGRDCSRG
jgi:hypothetical protein